jgi:hypothetical protein
MRESVLIVLLWATVQHRHTYFNIYVFNIHNETLAPDKSHLPVDALWRNILRTPFGEPNYYDTIAKTWATLQQLLFNREITISLNFTLSDHQRPRTICCRVADVLPIVP